MSAENQIAKGGASAPSERRNHVRWWTMISVRAKQSLPVLLKGSARRAWAWLQLQAVEIGKEIRQAANPPVRVRRLPGGAIAIVCKPAFGGMTTVLPVHEAAQVRKAPPEVSALIEEAGYTGEGDALITAWKAQILATEPSNVWALRSIELVRALVPALVALRKGGALTINQDAVRRFGTLEAAYELAQSEDVPAEARERLLELLRAIPGFKLDKGPNQSAFAAEQFGYVAMHAFSALRSENGTAARADVAVRSYPASGQGFLIGRFPDDATASHSMELISNALVGGRGAGRWALGAATAVVALVFVSALFREPATAGVTKEVGAAEQVQTEAPQADVLRDAFGASAGPLGATRATSEAPASSSQSLADKIYEQAMAASQQSTYQEGPPQSPIENPQAGDFGLGVSSKEGCDPALKFKVASQP